MKWKTLATVLVLVVSSVWVTGWTAYSQKTDSPKTTWEYKVVVSGHSEYKAGVDFDKFGAQGWELVAVDQTLQNGNSYSPTYYFKRPK
jgi:hypothetical protein